MKNWLVNPTGKPNSWVPVDLLQEHMNFWIKVGSHTLQACEFVIFTYRDTYLFRHSTRLMVAMPRGSG